MLLLKCVFLSIFALSLANCIPIVAMHGLNGYSIDYNNMATYVAKKLPGTRFVQMKGKEGFEFSIVNFFLRDLTYRNQYC